MWAFSESSAAILLRAAALDVETQIANIRVPPGTKTETLLQGRLTDEASNASGHVTVTLVDGKRSPVAGVGPVETDDSGYYTFILQPQDVEAIGVNRVLTLQVGNESGKLVPGAAKPFTLATGKITVSETRLQPSELEKLRLLVTLRDLSQVTASHLAGRPARTANAGATPKQAKQSRSKAKVPDRKAKSKAPKKSVKRRGTGGKEKRDRRA